MLRVRELWLFSGADVQEHREMNQNTGKMLVFGLQLCSTLKTQRAEHEIHSEVANGD